MGFYVENLVRELKNISGQDEYVLLKPQKAKDLSTPSRWWWDQINFPLQALKSKVDILHQPCFSAPIFYPGKIVVTVHDIISILYPKNMPFASRTFFSRWMPFSYRKADKIIADSEHTKKDIIKLLKIPDEKIRVIYLAANDDFRPIKDRKKIDDVCEKYGICDNFLLHVGTIEPRKNLEFLVRAYARARKDGLKKYKLVITGKKGWYYEGLFRLIQEFDLEKEVVFTGYVAEEDMPAIYNAASLLVFPSKYEGFGLPPLEAMACGAPVISSDSSSLPEVIGEAGMLLPISNEKAWASAINKVIFSPSLREKMRRDGLDRAKKFSWRKCAKETIKIYEEVYG